MGQSKGGGYDKKETLLPEQMGNLQQLLGLSPQLLQQAAQGYAQFLPGGGGGQAMTEQANKNFQQQTLPSILNAFGAGSKGGSALNQALAAGASDLNTNLASQLAQMQLGASQGIGNLGLGASQTGLGTPGFAYLQRQPPLWQQLLMSAASNSGNLMRGGAALAAL